MQTSRIISGQSKIYGSWLKKDFRTHISHIDTKIKRIEEMKNAEKEICHHKSDEEGEKIEQTGECFHQKLVSINRF